MIKKTLLTILLIIYLLSVVLLGIIIFKGTNLVIYIISIITFISFLMCLILIKMRKFVTPIYKDRTNKSIYKRPFLVKISILGLCIASLYLLYNLLTLIFKIDNLNIGRFIWSIFFIIVFSVFGIINFKK